MKPIRAGIASALTVIQGEAMANLATTKELRKLRVIGGKNGRKRIGKVRDCVFHPSERRCIGLTVRRPDFL